MFRVVRNSARSMHDMPTLCRLLARPERSPGNYVCRLHLSNGKGIVGSNKHPSQRKTTNRSQFETQSFHGKHIGNNLQLALEKLLSQPVSSNPSDPSPDKLMNLLQHIPVSDLFHSTKISIEQILTAMITHRLTVTKDPSVLPVLGSFILEIDRRCSSDVKNSLKLLQLLSLIAELGLKYSKLRIKEQQSLLRLLQLSNDQPLPLHQYATFFTLLNDLKLDWTTLTRHYREKIIRQLDEAITEQWVDEPELFTALAKLDVAKSNPLPAKLSKAILRYYQEIFMDLDQEIEVQLQALHTISRLGLTIEDLQKVPPLYSVLVDRWFVKANFDSVGNQEAFVRFLRSLGNLKFDYRTDSFVQESVIAPALLQHLPKMKLQNLSIVLSSLREMNGTVAVFPPPIQLALLDAITENLSRVSTLIRFDPQSTRDVSIILFVMGEMGFTITSTVPPTTLTEEKKEEESQLSTSILESVKRFAPRWDGRSLTTALHGLGKLGYRWKDFSPTLQSVVNQRLVEIFSPPPLLPAKKQSAESENERQTLLLDLSWLLSSCQLLQHHSWLSADSYDRLSTMPLREAVYQRLSEIYSSNHNNNHTLSREEIRAIPGLIFLLSEYTLFWQSFPDDFQQTIFQMIGTVYTDTVMYHKRAEFAMDATEVSRLCLGLAKFQCAWKDLTPLVQNQLLFLVERAIPVAEKQSILNMLFALTLLCFDEVTLDGHVAAVIQQLLIRQETVSGDSFTHSGSNSNDTEAARTQLAIVYTWLETIPTLRDLVKDKPVTLQETTVPSKLHRFFSQELRQLLQSSVDAAYLQLTDEYYGLPRKIFPMDIVVVNTKPPLVGRGRRSTKAKTTLIEIDGKLSHPRFQASNGQIYVERVETLKEWLYRYYHANQNVRIWRIPSDIIADKASREKKLMEIVSSITTLKKSS